MLLLPARTPPPVDSVHHLDLFSLCDWLIEAGVKVDMILTDLPYGNEKTKAVWDAQIPIAPLWARFKRVIKPRGAIVLTAAQPFSSELILSNRAMYRYSWYWIKPQGANFAMVNHQPLRVVEEVLIFSPSAASKNQFGNRTMQYFPQMETGESYTRRYKPWHAYFTKPSPSTHKPKQRIDSIDRETRFPNNVLEFGRDEQRGLHPTQKPVDLFRYLIRTYTQPGELVLDPCVGSGTTAIAAREEGRRFIVGDSSAIYAPMTVDRLAQPYTLPMFAA